jgi:hypothetical protein
MVRRVRLPIVGRRAKLARAAVVASTLALLGGGAALAGCGGTLKHAAAGAVAKADIDDSAPGSCAAVVMRALTSVAERIYREGVFSERTASALKMIESSSSLRTAVEAGDASAMREAARALLATGHMTNLGIARDGKTLLDVGGTALTPLHGTLRDANGAPIATFSTSVWSDAGLIDETDGIAEAQTIVRANAARGVRARTIAGAFALPPGKLPAQGTLTHDGVAYEFASYAGTAYPSSDPLRVYLVRTLGSLGSLCGASAQDTQFNTISRIARLIYEAEAGRRTQPLVRRVQNSAQLLEAVAHRDPQTARTAIDALLNHHIVRIRVLVDGRVLSDVGGAYVLAPVSAPLRLHGRTIGTVVLSIQDDEGYKRLAARLAGVEVVMYMDGRLVKSTIGPSPGAVPSSGAFAYRGSEYRAYTFYGEAFPSGRLRITDLIPLPYPGGGPLPAHAGTSAERLRSSASSSSSKEAANFSTPSRSSVSVTSL